MGVGRPSEFQLLNHCNFVAAGGEQRRIGINFGSAFAA